MIAASEAAIHGIVELINAGRIDLAEARCRRALKRNPRDVNATAMLGAILLKMRQPRQAERWLRQAVTLAPSFAKPHEDLGHLLVDAHRYDEAVAILETATRLDPRLDNAHFLLGKALAMVGRGKEADQAYEQSFRLNPERRYLAHAAEHHQAGRLEEAERAYREVLRANPRNVDALRMLGRLAGKAARLDDAERLFERAIELAPDFVAAIVDAGRLMQEQNRFEEAIGLYRRAIALEPKHVQAHFFLAGTLAPAALTFDAIEAYRKTLELKPDHAGAMLGLGHVLKTVGQQAEAIQSYRDCIAARPEFGEAYWSLANLKTYRLSEDDIAEMETRLNAEGLDDQPAVNFMFALAKAHEDRGDYQRAWAYYRDGNARQRMRESYDPVQTEVMNDALIEVFDYDFLTRYTGQGCADESPIFIVGLPRSGSTLIEQILASHSQVEGTAELPYVGRVATSLNRNRADGINYPQAVRELGAEHFQALGEDYLGHARLHRIEGAPRFIDKMPNNFPNIGLMHLMLPNARIIDARRHPLDSCLSCFRQLFARGQTFTYDLTEIGEYFLQYQRMMDYWEEVLPGRVLTVQYEELVTDFEPQVRRLVEYCGLPWEDACLEFHQTDRPIRTASSEQVRQPVYTGSIGFWRNYESHLGELIEVLEDVLPRYRQYESIRPTD